MKYLFKKIIKYIVIILTAFYLLLMIMILPDRWHRKFVDTREDFSIEQYQEIAEKFSKQNKIWYICINNAEQYYSVNNIHVYKSKKIENVKNLEDVSLQEAVDRYGFSTAEFETYIKFMEAYYTDCIRKDDKFRKDDKYGFVKFEDPVDASSTSYIFVPTPDSQTVKKLEERYKRVFDIINYQWYYVSQS